MTSRASSPERGVASVAGNEVRVRESASWSKWVEGGATFCASLQRQNEVTSLPPATSPRLPLPSVPELPPLGAESLSSASPAGVFPPSSDFEPKIRQHPHRMGARSVGSKNRFESASVLPPSAFSLSFLFVAIADASSSALTARCRGRRQNGFRSKSSGRAGPADLGKKRLPSRHRLRRGNASFYSKAPA